MTDAANNQQNPPDANGNTNEHEKKTEDQSEASSGNQDVTGTNEKRPNDLNIQVTSPEGTVRPHQGTPMILSDKENDEVEGEETKSSGEEQQAASGVLKASESKLDLASSPELEDKQFTNEAGNCFYYNFFLFVQEKIMLGFKYISVCHSKYLLIDINV